MADVTLTIDNSDAARKIQQTGQQLERVGTTGSRAGNKVGKSWRDNVNRQFFESRRQLRDMRSTFSEIALGFGVTIFARQLFDVNNRLISAKNALSAFTNSAEQNTTELRAVANISQAYGQDLLVMSENYTKLRAATSESALSNREIFEVFKSLSGASRVLNLDYRRTEGVFRAVIQMFSKGKVQAEELRGQLGEHIPGAFFLAAKAMGVSNEELDKMISRGEVTADELIPKLAEQFNNTFGQALPAAMQTSQAEFERFKNDFKIMVQDNQTAIDEAFTSIFKFGRKLITVYEGLVLAFGRVFTMLTYVMRSSWAWLKVIAQIPMALGHAITQALLDPFKEVLAFVAKQQNSPLQWVRDVGNAAQYMLNDLNNKAPGILEQDPFEILKNSAENVLKGDIPDYYAEMLAGLELQGKNFRSFLKKTMEADLIPEAGNPFKEDSGGFIDPNRPLNANQERQLRPIIALLDKEKALTQEYLRRHEIIAANTHEQSFLRFRLIRQNEEQFEREKSQFEAQISRERAAVLERIGMRKQAAEETFNAEKAALDELLSYGKITFAEFEEAKNRAFRMSVIEGNPFLSGMKQQFDLLGESLDVIKDKMWETFGNIGASAVNQFADAIAGAVVNGENLGESMRKVFQSIVKEVIASLIKIGVQMLVNFILSKTLFASALAAQVTAATTAAATWAPAAYLANVATLGAASAIGASTLISGLAVSQVASTAAAAAGGLPSFGGGRAKGGRVSNRHYYEVGEQGPEIFSDSIGRNFFIPPSSGNVEPMRQITPGGAYPSGAAPVTVNVHGAPEGTTVTQQSGADGTEIDIFIQRVDRAIANGILDGSSEVSTALNRIGVDRSQGVY